MKKLFMMVAKMFRGNVATKTSKQNFKIIGTKKKQQIVIDLPDDEVFKNKLKNGQGFLTVLDTAGDAENARLVEISENEKIKFSDNDTTFEELPANIICMCGERSYTTVFFVNREKFDVSKRVGVVAQWLPPSMFCQISKSTFVNKNEIKDVLKENNKWYVLLTKDIKREIARRRKNGFDTWRVQ